MRMKEIMPFVRTWVELKGIMLSEMPEEDIKYCKISLIHGI